MLDPDAFPPPSCRDLVRSTTLANNQFARKKKRNTFPRLLTRARSHIPRGARPRLLIFVLVSGRTVVNARLRRTIFRTAPHPARPRYIHTCDQMFLAIPSRCTEQCARSRNWRETCGESDREHDDLRGHTNETRAGRARTTREETESSNGGVSLARCVVRVASCVPRPIARSPATPAPPAGNQSGAAPGERGNLIRPRSAIFPSYSIALPCAR